VVAFGGDDQRIGIVANSLGEFFTRIEIESRIWYLTCHLEFKKSQDWEQLLTLLDHEDLTYLKGYFVAFSCLERLKKITGKTQ